MNCQTETDNISHPGNLSKRKKQALREIWVSFSLGLQHRWSGSHDEQMLMASFFSPPCFLLHIQASVNEHIGVVRARLLRGDEGSYRLVQGGDWTVSSGGVDSG